MQSPWEPNAKAAFLGMSLATDTSHLVRSVLEGLAAQIHELAASITKESDMELMALRVDGGLTRSRVLMQAVADLLGIPVEIYPSEHATPLGAAALAQVAIGAKTSLKDAIFEWEPSTVFEAEWSRHEAEAFIVQWSRAADAVVSIANGNS